MKTTIYTSALILALCCGSGAVAQNNPSKAKSCPDSVLLSKRTEGNYEIRQYLVKGQNAMDADYTVYFPIGSSKMVETFSDNAAEIKALKAFVMKFKSDTLKCVKSVKIKGWASPDGSQSLNQKLAQARVATFVAYLKSQCPAMKNCAIETSSAVATWKDCLPMLESASLANYKAAAEIINGDHIEAVKEAHLAKLPDVWAYLKSKVLPTLRCTQIEIEYTQSTIVEQRTMIKNTTPAPTAAPVVTSFPTPAPAATPAPQQQSKSAAPAAQTQTQTASQNQPVVIEKNIEYLIIEDKRKGVIIEMDSTDVDW